MCFLANGDGRTRLTDGEERAAVGSPPTGPHFREETVKLWLRFGAFSIGIITSRSVVERRQQIGMLRALGFSRAMVWRTFLLESSFVITDDWQQLSAGTGSKGPRLFDWAGIELASEHYFHHSLLTDKPCFLYGFL